jgi:hypothetical protein
MSTTLSHAGLPVSMKPFELLDVLEKLRSDLRLRDEDLFYLRTVFRLVRREDFQPGRICAFWENAASLADRLGFNVRRVARIEARLEARGLIVRTSAANGRRFGYRAEDGRILSAGGVNFGPPIDRANELVARLSSVAADVRQLRHDRQRATDLIREIRGLGVAEALEAARDAFPRLRPSEVQCRSRLHAVIDALEAIIVEFSASSGQTDESAPPGSSVRPNTNRGNNNKTCRLERGRDPGMGRRMPPSLVRELSGSALREVIDLYASAWGRLSPDWSDVVAAAREYAPMCGISGADWAVAKDCVGEARAALCLAVADRNSFRSDRFRVRSTARAFLGLVRKDTRDQAALEALIAELRRSTIKETRAVAQSDIAAHPTNNFQRSFAGSEGCREAADRL